MKGRIFEIKRMAVHDGDGIRTTVFFKGCPLKCVWCHNPEGIDFKPQIAYWQDKCVSCGECTKVCDQSAHYIENGTHIFERENCIGCGNCEEVCPADALTLYGKEMSIDELIPILLEDKDFYDNSGGGVTLSGGECLCQAAFCEVLLQKLKEYGINTAVDTCGFVKKESIEKVAPYTDTFLYDIKAMDDDVHIRCTGYSNKMILENIKYIDSIGKSIEVRIPYVPEQNSDQIKKISGFLRMLNNIKSVKVLPYHNYAGSKYSALNMQNTLPTILPQDDEIKKAEENLL